MLDYVVAKWEPLENGRFSPIVSFEILSPPNYLLKEMHKLASVLFLRLNMPARATNEKDTTVAPLWAEI